MSRATLSYLFRLHAAEQQLRTGTDPEKMRRRVRRLRDVAPDQQILPALEARIAVLESGGEQAPEQETAIHWPHETPESRFGGRASARFTSH